MNKTKFFIVMFILRFMYYNFILYVIEFVLAELTFLLKQINQFVFKLRNDFIYIF